MTQEQITARELKPNELRIGNLVWLDGFHDEPYEIKEGGDIDGYESYEGIPLSESWLIRAGFEKREIEAPGIEKWDCWSLGIFEIHDMGNGEYAFITSIGRVLIRYVHTLQNIFYFLNVTQTELQFKPL